MDVTTLLARILAAGFSMKVEGGTLFVEPSDKITDRHCHFFKAHKPELLAALTGKLSEAAQREADAAWLDAINRAHEDRLLFVVAYSEFLDRRVDRIKEDADIEARSQVCPVPQHINPLVKAATEGVEMRFHNAPPGSPLGTVLTWLERTRRKNWHRRQRIVGLCEADPEALAFFHRLATRRATAAAEVHP